MIHHAFTFADEVWFFVGRKHLRSRRAVGEPGAREVRPDEVAGRGEVRLRRGQGRPFGCKHVLTPRRGSAGACPAAQPGATVAEQREATWRWEMMKWIGGASALALAACSDPAKTLGEDSVNLQLEVVGAGTLNVSVGESAPRIRESEVTSFNQEIFADETVLLSAVPTNGESGDPFQSWSGNHPSCSGTQSEIVLGPGHTEDISCTATFGSGDPPPIYSVVFYVNPGGSVDLTDEAGTTTTCDAASSPCGLEVQGDNLVVVGRPENDGHIVVFDPPCPDQEGATCTYGLADLDPLGSGEVELSVSFADPGAGTRNVLEACTGLSYTYEGPFGGAMFQVSPDETCTVVSNDGGLLGTFAISGGNGFGGDELLYVAAITEPSEWMSSGYLTDILLNGDPLGSGRMAVPLGIGSSQVFTLIFDSGLEAEVQIDGTPAPPYTTVTQTIVEISLPAEP
jgi:hypothetical protein